MPNYSLEIGTWGFFPPGARCVVKEDDKEICAYHYNTLLFHVVARLPNGKEIVITRKGFFKTIYHVSVGSNKEFQYTLNTWKWRGLRGPKGERVLNNDEITLEGGERVYLCWRGGHPIAYEWTLKKPEHKNLVIALAIIAYHLRVSAEPQGP